MTEMSHSPYDYRVPGMEMMSTSSMPTLPVAVTMSNSMSPIEIKMEVDGIDGYGNMPTPPGMSSGEGSPGSSHSGTGRARKVKEDKICGVCGDRALGYNFDAISCESCKAFFRRNAPKGLEYFKCPYDEKCKMDISNRRFCKRCRLKKCFDIGMRKEYILTDQEKAAKRKKIEENSQQRAANCRLLRDMERVGLYMPPTSSTDQPPLQLSAEDSAEIMELQMAYNSSLEINMEEEASRDRATSMSDLVNIAEISVRRVIGMAKKIKSFTALEQSDQIALLKGGSIELLILRSVITFDKEKQHFLDPGDKEDRSAMKIEQLQRAEGGRLFEDHMRFVKSIAMDLEADQVSLMLLLVISLFSPDRPNLVNKQLVAQEQEKYSMLLKKHMEATQPRTARLLYPKLLMKLTDIRNLNEDHSQVLLKINPGSIQPLMQEVLDIRTH